MFGLFKSKPAASLSSTVAPEVGAPLKRETAFTATPTPLPSPAYNRCKPVGVFGDPPKATFETWQMQPGNTQAFGRPLNLSLASEQSVAPLSAGNAGLRPG